MILSIDPGNKIYKVYKHTCPNKKVYIGITSLSVNNRWRNGKGYKNSKYFARAIEKYGWENIKHEILYDNLIKAEAEKLEKEMIIKHKSFNKNYGYNIELGGQTGAKGIKRSQETLEKMRKANLGRKMSINTKLKISESLKGRVFSDKHREKKSLAQAGEKNHMYGKKVSQETRIKMINSQPKGSESKFSRKVVQISIIDNSVIKVWESMGDIRRELGIKHCGISDCCRGKQKTAGGYIWRYYE